ncbi:hypothetical protein F5Y06DRAFT_285402 [Hypoxylon sp. FL0890]|nr:hypothetical protein F5Y06DRAFT_285402 [Hypoxylon sp. FL0890]
MAPVRAVSNKPQENGMIALMRLALVWSVAALLTLNLLAKKMDPTLIVYAYKKHENARENFKFFAEQGIRGYADVVFILNGGTDVADLIPKRDIILRSNICVDLGTFGKVLREGGLWKRYKRFITMNVSLRGPFIPFGARVAGEMPILSSMRPSPTFTDPRTTLSPLAAVTRSFTGLSTSKWAQPVSSEALEYKVSAIMSALPGEQHFNECDEHPKDLLFDNSHFGTNLHPYEIIFFKANRGINPPTLDLLTSLHLSGQQGRSLELCQR